MLWWMFLLENRVTPSEGVKERRLCVFVFLTNKDFTLIIEESKWSRYRLHGNPQSSIGTVLHNDALYTPMGSFILKEVKEETC